MKDFNELIQTHFGPLNSQELSVIHSYFKKYPLLGLKRLAFELEQNEDITISESSLRAIRKEI
jgi:hypothetical protein